MDILFSPIFAFGLGAFVQLLLFFLRVRNFKKLLLVVLLFLGIVIFTIIRLPHLGKELYSLPYLLAFGYFFLLAFFIFFSEDLLITVDERVIFVLTLFADFLIVKMGREALDVGSSLNGFFRIIPWWFLVFCFFIHGGIFLAAFLKFKIPSWLKALFYSWFLIVTLFLNFLANPLFLPQLRATLTTTATKPVTGFDISTFFLGSSFVFSGLIGMQLLLMLPQKRERTASWKKRLQNYIRRFMDHQLAIGEVVLIFLSFLSLFYIDTLFHFDYKMLIGVMMFLISIYMRYSLFYCRFISKFQQSKKQPISIKKSLP